MRVPRIYTPQALHCGELLTLEPQASQHLIQVLRLKIGAQVNLFNGDGWEYQAEITQTGRAGCSLGITAREQRETTPSLDLRLALGISKSERMDIAIQKAVELGVVEIMPLITERTNVRLDAQRLEKKVVHWSHIVTSACEQSNRNRLPTVHSPLSLNCWLDQGFSSNPLRLTLDPFSNITLSTTAPPAQDQAIWILVGPEGGLGTQEIHLAAQAGFVGIRLGPRVLRTETAPLAALAAIQTLWGDFR